ncbi:MAG: hypothetical protein Q8N26_30570 [Myxococcales bacterium]|nr:hypothetical protein [Myxococcales bacterium]
MIRLSLALPCLCLLACGGTEALKPPASLMEGVGDTHGVRGLERLEGMGTYVSGATERFRVHVDPALVQRVEFSASSGALTASGSVAEWTLPPSSMAELSVRVVRRDGSSGQVSWQFAIQAQASSNRATSAQAALLAAPMPVLDGGTLEVSGGACDVKYEGTTTNVAIAFTTATHPALMYGRWNGSTWALEVVDAMGFNTGGVVDQHVQLQVEANGAPHLLYVRDNQVFYATKSGASWLRERVDSATEAFSTSGNHARPSLTLGAAGAPSIVYGARPFACGFNCDRVVVAVRGGPSSWTRAVVSPASPVSSNSSQSLTGDLTYDGSRLLFPIVGSDSSTSFSRSFLVGWTATATTVFAFGPNDARALDGVVVSPTRALYRTDTGLHDVTLSSVLSSSTRAFSSVEQNTSSFTGDIVWAQTRPVLLHLHGSVLELVSPNPAGFWSYTQLGSASSSSASLAVHPTSGDVSLCYQSGGRITFQ